MLAIKPERLSFGGETIFYDCFAADREQAHSYSPQYLLRDSAASDDGRAPTKTSSAHQCSFIRGSVPLPMRLPSISIRVRKVP